MPVASINQNQFQKTVPKQKLERLFFRRCHHCREASLLLSNVVLSILCNAKWFHFPDRGPRSASRTDDQEKKKKKRVTGHHQKPGQIQSAEHRGKCRVPSAQSRLALTNTGGNTTCDRQARRMWPRSSSSRVIRLLNTNNNDAA